MKRILFMAVVLAVFSVVLSAGDVATFVDKGFSDDGKSYVFGQFGRTDNKFQGWAEIYHVDIASNDYVDGGVFKINPTAVTAEKSGKEVYGALESKSDYYIKKLGCKPADADHVLYICDDAKKSGTDEIVFKDYRSASDGKSDVFSIQLIPTVSGTGKNVRSSFFIMMEVTGADGNVKLRRKIGNPDIVRKGISAYKIERIMCDKTGTRFIFVVEKTLEDENGTSIRYMVEAVQL